MIVEIVNPQGKVSYTRPHDHPDVLEAFNTPGYSVRGSEAAIADSLQRMVSRRLTRARLTAIENRLGWGGSDKWPVAEPIRFWACAAETILDERDAIRRRLEMIGKICKSTKHLDQIGDILKECEAANGEVSDRAVKDGRA